MAQFVREDNPEQRAGINPLAPRHDFDPGGKKVGYSAAQLRAWRHAKRRRILGDSVVADDGKDLDSDDVRAGWRRLWIVGVRPPTPLPFDPYSAAGENRRRLG